MDTAVSLLVLSTLTQLVAPKDSLYYLSDSAEQMMLRFEAVQSVTSFSTEVQIVSGRSRVFPGENVQLKCSVPDGHRSNWDYMWFRESDALPQTGEYLSLWNVKVKGSGKYYCQGVRDTIVGNIHTLKSLPVELTVDGGWAILEVPPHPTLVRDTLRLTCRVRTAHRLHEVILYKDGVEVVRQKGLNAQHFSLTNLAIEDQGMYSCRGSWNVDRRTHSVISADVPVQVLEVLSEPIMEIVTDSNLIPAGMMKLICHTQYNAPAPAPPVHFYFYRNNNRLGTATSENYDLTKRTAGWYSCKARVPELDLARLSKPKSFGQVIELQMTPPAAHRPSAPRASTPDLSLPPAVEPTATQPSPRTSTATPTYTQPTDASTQALTRLPEPSQSVPLTVFPNQTAVQETSTISVESGDTSGESGDMSEESGDMPEE